MKGSLSNPMWLVLSFTIEGSLVMIKWLFVIAFRNFVVQTFDVLNEFIDLANIDRLHVSSLFIIGFLRSILCVNKPIGMKLFSLFFHFVDVIYPDLVSMFEVKTLNNLIAKFLLNT